MTKFFITFTFLILLSTQSAFSQKGKKFFEMAKKAYPDYQKSINYLNKAIFEDGDNKEFRLARAKVKLFSGQKVLISQAESELSKLNKNSTEYDYIACWADYADICKNGVLTKKFLDSRNVDTNNLDLLSSFVLIHVYTYRKERDFQTQTLFEKFDQGAFNLNSLVACLKVSKHDHKLYSYQEKIINAFENLPVEEVLNERDLAFTSKSIPIFENINETYLNQEDRSGNIFNNPKLLAKISKNKSLIKSILLFENHREKLSLSAYKAANKKYPKFNHAHSFFSVLYNSGDYELLIEHSKGVQPINKAAVYLTNFYLGLSLYEMGLYDQASLALSKTLPYVKIDYLTPPFYIIRSLVKAGKSDKAFQFANQWSVAHVNREAQKKLFLCEYYFSTGNLPLYHKTRKEITNYISNVNNNHFLAISNLASLKSDRKIQLFDHKILQKNGLLDELLISQIETYLYQKDPKADEVLKYLEEIQPDNIKSKIIKAKSLAVKQKPEEALKKIEVALRASSKNAAAITLKGMIQLEQNKFKEAYSTFSTLPNPKTAAFYKLIPLFCLGKYDLIEQSCKKLLKINTDDQNIILLHMLMELKNKETAKAFLNSFLPKLQTHSAKYYADYKLGKINFDEYQKRQDFGPDFGLRFNFYVGFEAMINGDKEKSREHFTKCLNPYSIDQPEYHMAKACLK